MMFEKVYTLDTNILLEDAKNIFNLSDENKNLIVLPETVLDEIDSKKTGFDEINFQAREFARILENSQIIQSKKVADFKIVTIKVFDIFEATIDVISKEEYLINIKNVAPNIINDRKILEVAKFVEGHYKCESNFLSLDIMARTRAVSMDIKTDSLLGTSEKEFDYEFIKTITIQFEQLETINNSSIFEYDEEHKAYNFAYCFKVKGSDQVLLACVQNKKIIVLDESEIRNQIITPLNKEQLFFQMQF